MLDKVELPAIVEFIVGKGGLDVRYAAFPYICVVDCLGAPDLTLFLQLVVLIELVEDVHELVENTHREGAGAAGRVKHF